MNHISSFKKVCLVLTCLFIFNSCEKEKNSLALKENVGNYSSVRAIEINYKIDLNNCISSLEKLNASNNFEDALAEYIMARRAFKLAQPVLSFVDKNNYMALNAPNILKIEEEDVTDIKIKNPFGFQVIEETIHEKPYDKIAVGKIVTKTINRLKLIEQNTLLKLKPYHIIWLIRDEIARVALTGITGFDSPVLEASLEEAKLSYTTIEKLIDSYKSYFKSNSLYEEWKDELENTKKALSGDFNLFDRYSFIKTHSHIQLELLNKTVKDWDVQFPFEVVFNNEITTLFSASTFNMDFFADYVEDNATLENKKALGKALFNDKRLSINNEMSCATCHQQSLAFTDNKKIFKGQKRNTPTLKYAALQQSMFYDGRIGNLEGQIVEVVNNENEFHSTLNDLYEMVSNDKYYHENFKALYNENYGNANIRNAIAVYIRSLAPFNSKFDNNINGLESTLTGTEINGFNLFMGKAKCATCHFPPVFNGTVPPNFTETEFELLGVPKDIGENSEIDADLGRYDVFHTTERKYFFKTPTVRNISQTAPYMHNGVYKSLEEVMEFYNIGGGYGLGLDIEYQTLPPDSLNLNNQEIKSIIAFMETLDDN